MNLDKKAGGPEYAKVVDALAEDDKARTDFLKACLAKLGLQVTQETTTVPSLSTLHLSALRPEDTSELLSSLRESMTQEDGREYLKDENDTFFIETPSVWKMEKLEESLPEVEKKEEAKEEPAELVEGIIDYNKIVKHVVVHDELPSSKATPYFNHYAFFSNLQHYRSKSSEPLSEFGSQILYGEVITSTSTILEK